MAQAFPSPGLDDTLRPVEPGMSANRLLAALPDDELECDQVVKRECDRLLPPAVARQASWGMRHPSGL